MGIITSIILGIVEGVTEFLPVSSTGHLILTTQLLGLESSEFIKSFSILIQLGAILAVLALYWQKLLTNFLILKRVIVAFIPTAIIGLIFYRLVKTYLLGNSWVVLIALFLGGLILIIFEITYREREGHQSTLEQISFLQAFVIGLCQSLAMIPGVSRSAATIIGGLALGLKREVIVEFSFLLAIPVMLAATSLDLFKSSAVFSTGDWYLLLIGFFTSFLAALLAIKTFLNYIRHHNFIIFGFYRLAIAVIFLVIFLI